MKKSSLLVDEYPLIVLPSLAKEIGLNEAIALQQLHYWLGNPKGGVMLDGFRWVYNTYEDWQKDNFPFWSVRTVQRIFGNLEGMELVISMQKAAYDRKKYYRVHYDKLASWNETDCRNAEFQVGTIEDAKVAPSLTETTTETKTESTNKKSPALDFRSMSVMDAQKLPSLKLYKKAADFWPGSLVWELVHNEITKHNLTFKQINDAAVAWESRGFKRENVKGILEWAVNGVPKSSKGQDTQSPAATFGPAYKPFVPKEESDAVPPPPEVLEKLRSLKSKMNVNNKRVGVRHDQ